jgi:hypothetical protein
MQPEPAAIGAVLALSSRVGIHSVIIGGVALVIHGQTHATCDLDLLAACPVRRLLALRRLVEESDGRWDPLWTRTAARRSGFSVNGLSVDLLRPWNPEMRGALQRAQTLKWNGLRVRVPPLTDVFLLRKCATHL